MKILEFKSQEEFLSSFTKGELKGFYPAETIDTNTLTYPVKVEAYPNLKTFKLHKELNITKEVMETPQQETKKKLSKKVILGLSIGIPLSIVIIVAIVLMCIYL